MWVKILKWFFLLLVLPAGVAALGLFVIGPSFSQVPVLDKGAQKVSDLLNSTDGADPQAPAAPAPTPEPKSKVTADETEVRRSRNKHRRPEITVIKEGRPKEEEPAVNPDEPLPGENTAPPDENSDPPAGDTTSPNQGETQAGPDA